MSLIKSGFRSLSTETLISIVEDAQARIGSHIGMSEYHIQAYVDEQRAIIESVQNELERRESDEVRNKAKL